MADWLNSDTDKLVGIIKVDNVNEKSIEDIIEELYVKKQIPKGAVVTATEQLSNSVRIRFVKNYDTAECDKISGKRKPKREVMIRASLEEKPVIKKELKSIKNLIITGEETTDKYYRVKYAVM